MKKLLLFTLLIIGFKANAYNQSILEVDTPTIDICTLPATNTGTLHDWLVKEDSTCFHGTKKMNIVDFITHYVVPYITAYQTDSVHVGVSQIGYGNTTTGLLISDANATRTTALTFIRNSDAIGSGTFQLRRHALNLSATGQVPGAFLNLDSTLSNIIYTGRANSFSGINFDETGATISNYGNTWKWPNGFANPGTYLTDTDGFGHLAFSLVTDPTAWHVNGNAGTNSGTNFIGTTDNHSFVIRTNDTARVVVDSLGNTNIGDASNYIKIGVLIGGYAQQIISNDSASPQIIRSLGYGGSQEISTFGDAAQQGMSTNGIGSNQYFVTNGHGAYQQFYTTGDTGAYQDFHTTGIGSWQKWETLGDSSEAIWRTIGIKSPISLYTIGTSSPIVLDADFSNIYQTADTIIDSAFVKIVDGTQGAYKVLANTSAGTGLTTFYNSTLASSTDSLITSAWLRSTCIPYALNLHAGINACSNLPIHADSINADGKIIAPSLRISTGAISNGIIVTDANGNYTPTTKAVIDGYKDYQAMLTQTSTSAPTATQYVNSTGITFTWARSGVGTYTITANSGTPFTANKTVVTMSLPSLDLVSYKAVVTSTTVITVTTGVVANVATVATNVATDAQLSNTLIEIKIFN